MKMLLSLPSSQTPAIAASRHIGTMRMTLSGSDQLSYCAASTRKTSSTQSGKTNTAELPARICWYVSSVHSYFMPGGSELAAIASMAASAWPELKPGAGAPLISAAG